MKDIHLKDIKKDQVFYEGSFDPTKIIALEDAYVSGFMKHDGKKLTQWRCKAKLFGTEQVIDYLVTENLEHYGPKLYVQEEIIDDGTPKYRLTKIESLNDTSKNSHIHDNYWVVGSIVREPAVGEVFIMARDSNTPHPEGRYGIFNTSRVSAVSKLEDNTFVIETRNSKYKLEKL